MRIVGCKRDVHRAYIPPFGPRFSSLHILSSDIRSVMQTAGGARPDDDASSAAGSKLITYTHRLPLLLLARSPSSTWLTSSSSSSSSTPADVAATSSAAFNLRNASQYVVLPLPGAPTTICLEENKLNRCTRRSQVIHTASTFSVTSCIPTSHPHRAHTVSSAQRERATTTTTTTTYPYARVGEAIP